jgi:hypothetical protein
MSFAATLCTTIPSTNSISSSSPNSLTNSSKVSGRKDEGNSNLRSSRTSDNATERAIGSHRLSSAAAHSFCGVQNCSEYSRIDAAPAYVSCQRLLDIFGRWSFVLVEKTHCCHDEAGGAEAALQSIVFNKSLLNGMEFAIFRQTFNGNDVVTFGVNSQHHAGINWLPVHQDGASAAFASVANLFRARQVEVVAERIKQGDAGLKLQLIDFAVHPQRHGDSSKIRAAKRPSVPSRFLPFSTAPFL